MDILKYYEILCINKRATIDEIKYAYKQLCLKYHPDRNKNTDTTAKMSEINSAYEIIMGAIP